MSDKKVQLSLEAIMGDRFGKYSKYIIQERALPDVRDGLKPVQRRILYSMFKEGNLANRPYRKSAKTVGNVIGNYHPHGDSSVYEAMVRLSQSWKMRTPLVDMQGNNGSIDNDPAAAMRYTEARLAPIATELLQDLDKDTVLLSLNFDDTEYEPTVLPAYYPNLLVNGSTGISAGYATDIPPHNLAEIIDATVYRVNNPDCDLDDLMRFIKGPDFPTGAIVEGKAGIREAFSKGKGKVVVRSKTEIIEGKKLNQILISEIPYEVNKADLVRKIDEIRFNRDIEGIEEVRDESDRDGLRIAVDLNKDIDAVNVLNYLYKNTELQKNYNYNMVAIKDKRPVLMGIVDILDGYINHQIDVVTRKTIYDLNKANDRIHIVDGLIKAISLLDDVVKVIRKSKDRSDAINNLVLNFGFTKIQSEAIVMLQLYRLTNTDILALESEKAELKKRILHYNVILDSDEVLRQEIITNLETIKTKYPMPRLTEIKDQISDIKVDTAAMILSENIYVSLTYDGYIKRMSPRSVKASEGTALGKKEDDWVVGLLEANTLNTLLAFTNKGNYLYIPVHKIEEFKWKDPGKHLSYLVKLSSDEKIIKVMLVDDFSKLLYVVLVTRQGQIKRTALSEFNVQRYSKPLKAINLKGNDQLVGVGLTDNQKGLALVTKAGYGTIYNEQEISVLGIKASGIKALNIKNDELVGLDTFDPLNPQGILLLTKDFEIKRVKISDIPVGKRTTKGTTLYKNPKSRIIETVAFSVCQPSESFAIISNTFAEKEIKTSDFPFANLSQKPKPINHEKGTQAIWLQGPGYLATLDYKLENNPASQKKEFNLKKEQEIEQISLDDFINL